MSIEMSSLPAAASGRGAQGAQHAGLEGMQGGMPAASPDAQRFAQALAAYKEQKANPAAVAPSGIESKSIGSRMIAGLSDIAVNLKADHKAVSSMIEKATLGGDDAMMMKAMLALADYQQRVQIVSKTVSKAASSLDQLTRLQ
jgi:hypothetical protein